MKERYIMTRRFGFTLAEVLITLGIIGVVAAMTMPTLMNSTNGAQYKTAYKKALSVLNQAVVLNVALDDYDLSQATGTGTADDQQSIYTMLKNRMNVVKTGDGSQYKITVGNATQNLGENNYTLYFNDGITFTFARGASGKTKGVNCTEENPCYGLIDVNGEKSPNKMTLCDGDTTPNYDPNADDDCEVGSPADVYPVKLFDQSILPTSTAAKAVLYGK